MLLRVIVPHDGWEQQKKSPTFGSWQDQYDQYNETELGHVACEASEKDEETNWYWLCLIYMIEAEMHHAAEFEIVRCHIEKSHHDRLKMAPFSVFCNISMPRHVHPMENIR